MGKWGDTENTLLVVSKLMRKIYEFSLANEYNHVVVVGEIDSLERVSEY